MIDTDRKKTIETLIELASGWNPGDCWDQDRAERLLRSQSTAEELKEMGADPALIERIWPKDDGR
jgi:hypothetical protein